MDTTKTITHVSLCAGYGGIDLGLSRAIPNLRTIAFSEIEAFACANLVAKMEAGYLDAAPIWTDIKTFPWEDFRDRVDILSGGYPCQPFSAAGKRLGRDDPRHLWPWIADGIVSMRPRICFFENVEGHISLGLQDVIGELESIGYAATWGVFSAAEVGAPHQRKRVFILAHLNNPGLEGRISAGIVDSLRRQEPSNGHAGSSGHNGAELANGYSCGRGENSDQGQLWSDLPVESSGDSGLSRPTQRHQIWPSRPGEQQFWWEPPRVVGNTKHNGSHQCSEETRGSIIRSEQQGRDTSWGSGEESGADNELSQAQPSVGGDSDGSANRMDDAELFVTSDNRTDELRMLGNGVVPVTATRAFLTLMDQLLNENA